MPPRVNSRQVLVSSSLARRVLRVENDDFWGWRSALQHAEAAEKAKDNSHTKEGITHLNAAIDHGKGKQPVPSVRRGIPMLNG
jgi:Small metal-binding protein